MHSTYAFAALFLAILTTGLSGDDVDLNGIDRRIGEQPAYVSDQPLYGLVVLGPSAKTRIWMVLDKSSEGAEKYDVLYADLNGDGDLTDPTERVEASTGSFGAMEFRLPDPIDPETGEQHTEFKVAIRDRGSPTHMVSLRWHGKSKFGGGYPADPDTGYMQFAKSPADAPIIWLNGDGPFRFQRWYSSEFKIGGADDLRVFLGLPGVGKSSFCAFQEHVLPADEGVRAELIYADRDGKERRTTYELMDRC